MGGVFIDEPHHPVAAFADDVGVQHLPGDPPGFLPLRLQRRLPGDLQCLPLRRNGGHHRPGPLRDGGYVRFPGGGRRGGKGSQCAGHRAAARRRRIRAGCGAGRFGRPIPGRRHRRRGAAQSAGQTCGIFRRGDALHSASIGRADRQAIRHPGGTALLRVPHRAASLGLCRGRRFPGGRGGFFPEGLGVHGLKEVLPGIDHLLRRFRGGDRGALGVQAVHDGVVHRVEHLPLPGELHLGLGGVDVHIHRRHRQRHRQHTSRELSLHDLVAVPLLQRRREKLGLDVSAVDEEGLHGPGTPAHQGFCDKAGDADAVPPALHRHQAPGKVPAQGGVDGGVRLPVAGGVEGLRSVLDEFEGDVRVGQGQMLHEPCHGGGLGAVLAHELQPGRGVVEEVPHQHGGALRRAHALHLAGHTPFQVQRGPDLGLVLPGKDVRAADGGDGGQGLAPEAQGADLPQVRRGAQLGGGMAQESGGQLPGSDTAAVVRDPDEAHAAPLDLHHHCRGAGVNGVFHQFLDHAGRALHHLAGGDQVRHMGFELLNVRHAASPFREGSVTSASPPGWEW